MKKSLKIRFVKFENALVMQILEQEGKFKWGSHVGASCFPKLSCNAIYLRGDDSEYNLKPVSLLFSSNAKRDEYLAQVVQWITDEQFANSASELKVGEMCEVKTDEVCALCEGVYEEWKARKLLAILPAECRFRFIFASEATSDGWACANVARPLASCVQPKIDGDVYTWEMEVAE